MTRRDWAEIGIALVVATLLVWMLAGCTDPHAGQFPPGKDSMLLFLRDQRSATTWSD